MGLVERLVPTLKRLMVGLATAGVVAVVLYTLTGRSLTAPIDVVGYPTFVDFDFHPQFVLYRLLVWDVPLVTWAVMWALRRGGPLRVEVSERAGSGHEALPPADRATSSAETLGGASWWSVALRLAPQAVLVAVAADAWGAHPHRGFTALGLAAASVYLLLVVVAIALASRLRRTGFVHAAAGVNVLSAPAVAVLGFQHFAAGTAVIGEEHRVRHLGWFPLWLALVLLLCCYGWGAWRRRRGWSVERLEWWAVTVLTGSAIVAVATSHLPHSLGTIQGFDDMQSVTGADLMTRGYFPWRDFYFIHGIFEDALRSLATFSTFGHSLWATSAGIGMWWSPLFAVGCYLFVVRLTLQRWLLRLSLSYALVWLTQRDISVRWCFLGFVVLLFYEALSRSRVGWTALYTVVAFVVAVIVPETSFLVMATTLVLVAQEVVARERGTGWTVGAMARTFSRTATYILTGLACTVLWSAYLASQHALGPFIDYYRTFGPGHAASGALPVGPFTTASGFVLFGVVVAAVLVGLVLPLNRLLRGLPMAPLDWILLATSVFAGLYNEKALARFDGGHILQVCTAAVPVIAAVCVATVERLTLLLASQRRLAGRLADRSVLREVVGAVALLVAVVVLVPSAVANALAMPGNNRSRVVTVVEHHPLLGFTTKATYRPAYVRRMGEVLDTLAGRHGVVFDGSNSPGYFYYLLQRRLATRYYHISMAVPEFVQRDLVAELQQSRPAVVVFDAFNIGLPAWDGPRPEVRHFLVAQYVLDHYRPVVSVEGTLFLLRDDLSPDEAALRRIGDDTTTVEGLQSSAQACDWGDSANFLTSEPKGRRLRLTLERGREANRLVVQGWAYDDAANRPVRDVYVAVGNRVVTTLRTSGQRPDVAQGIGRPGAATSGFAGSTLTSLDGRPQAYSVLSDGAAHAIGPPRAGATLPTFLRLRDGSQVPVAHSPGLGHVDSVQLDRERVSRVPVPAGTNLADYDLATFTASGGAIGHARIQIGAVRASTVGLAQPISFDVLPLAGRSISVRVGSCLQWHDTTDGQLFVVQHGGRPIRDIYLSAKSIGD